MTLVIIYLSLLIANCLSQTPPHPQRPDIFYSQWNWYEAFTDGPENEGNCVWAYNGENMYLDIQPIRKKQLIVGNKFYEWNTLIPHDCGVITVNYPLVEHWFDNTTFSGLATYYDPITNESKETVAMWIGSLDFGVALGNYVVYSNLNTGLWGTKYIAINIYRDNLNRPGSEINDLKVIQYTLPNGSEDLFVLPTFCEDAKVKATNTSLHS